MITICAVIGALIGFIPGGTFLLIPMEMFMLYKIMDSHNAFDLMTFIGLLVPMLTISAFLKGLASFLHAVPVIGQVANSIVAVVFIISLGNLAEQHYAGKAQTPRTSLGQTRAGRQSDDDFSALQRIAVHQL